MKRSKKVIMSAAGDENGHQNNAQRDPTKKREDYISWDDYFMGVAKLSAMRSKDPITQVGACIVNKEDKIVGVGYNGMPNGCSDDEFSWAREDKYNNYYENKDLYVCHAEMNAIMNKNVGELRDCRIYVTLFPCNQCARLIIQSGIKKVIYLDKKEEIWGKRKCIATRKMFDEVPIEYIEYDRKITINFDAVDKNNVTPDKI